MFTHAFIHEAGRKHPKHTMPAHSQEGKRTQNPFAQAVAERVGTEREQQHGQAEKADPPPQAGWQQRQDKQKSEIL